MTSSLKLVAQVSLIPTGCFGVLAMVFVLCFDVGEIGKKFRSVLGSSIVAVSVWFAWFVSWYVMSWFVLDMVPLENSLVLLSVLGNSTLSMLWFVIVLEILRSETNKNVALFQMVSSHRVVHMVSVRVSAQLVRLAWRCCCC